MIVLNWNCWGPENLHVANVLSHLVREKVPNILFLMEKKNSGQDEEDSSRLAL